MQEPRDLAVVEVVRDEDAAQAAERDERDHRKNALRDDEVAAAGLDAGHPSDGWCATRRRLLASYCCLPAGMLLLAPGVRHARVSCKLAPLGLGINLQADCVSLLLDAL